MRKRLSQRQQQILDYIFKHIEEKGYPPTVREIGEAVNLSSSSTVHLHLVRLQELGLIKRDAVLTRAIRLVDDGPKSAGHAEGKAHGAKASGRALTSASQRSAPTVRFVPLLGRVAAGAPILAEQENQESYPIPPDFLAGAEGFMLGVKGDSMIDDGIHDGDMVIVRRQPNAINGDTVVAMIDGEATVKRFHRDKTGIRLDPANPSYKPIKVRNPEIIGKVVGLIRRM